MGEAKEQVLNELTETVAHNWSRLLDQ